MAINSYHRHYHKRQAKETAKGPIDKLVYLGVIFGPLMTLPQVYDIWVLGRTDVSLVSWIAYLIIAVIWLAYGIKHKAKPIINVQIAWIILDAAIVTGLMIN